MPSHEIPSPSRRQDPARRIKAEAAAGQPAEASLDHILKALRESPDAHVSGSLLASRIGISRTSVWKHIQALGSRGYHIETHPRRGYLLRASPDLLLPEELLHQLHTRSIGRSYHHLLQTTSTNDHAMSLALQGAPHGTLVAAEEQTQGRGRLQRPWTSTPRHGIYCSLLLRGPLPLDRAPQITMVTALSLTRLLRRRWKLDAWTKWPNDVLIHGKKVAGILTEAKSDPDQVLFLVMGIGININHRAVDLAGPFRYPATSLALELGRTLSRAEFLAALLDDFEVDFEMWREEGFEPFHRDWEATSWILNKTVTLQGSEGLITGKAIGFSPEGALRLLQIDGAERLVWAGDVVRVEGID